MKLRTLHLVVALTFLFMSVCGFPRKRPQAVPPALTRNVACRRIAAAYCDRYQAQCRRMDACFPAFMVGCCGTPPLPSCAAPSLTDPAVERCEAELDLAVGCGGLAGLPASCPLTP